MRTKNISLVLATVITVFTLVACTQENRLPPAPKQTPTITSTPTPLPTQEPTPTITRSPGVPFIIDNKMLLALAAPAGIDQQAFGRYLSIASDMASNIVGNTVALSGRWAETGGMNALASTFAPYAVSNIVDKIASLDPINPDNSYSVMSVAAVFTNSAGYHVPPACVNVKSVWQDCLSADIVFTEPSVSVDESLGAVKISFTATSRRLLVKDSGSWAHSDIIYHLNIWVGNNNEKVIAFDNSFEFGKISAGE